MAVELRPYQTDAIQSIQQVANTPGARSILVLPTGSGKTICAQNVISDLATRGKKTLFIVDRRSLISQTRDKFAAAGLNVGVLQGANTSIPDNPDVVVASIQTVRARQTLGIKPDFLICDEIHILHKALLDVLLDLPDTPCLGMSATPLNAELKNHFSELIVGPSTRQMVEQGYLVPCEIYAPSAHVLQRKLASVPLVMGDFQQKGLAATMDSAHLVGNIVETWKRLADGRPTLAFCVNVLHSKNVANAFTVAGIPSEHIDAKTTDAERAAVFQRFVSGETKVVCSIMTIGVGVDLPEAEVAILARPTLSKMLHIQQIGRVLRPNGNKRSALILDHASNTLLHGTPTDFFVTEIPERETVPRKAVRKYKACFACDAVLKRQATECYRCGVEQPRKHQRMVEVHNSDGELVSLKPEAEGEKKLRWLSELTTVGVNRGYKKTWASTQWKQKFGVWPNGEQPRYLGTEWKSLSPDIQVHVDEGRKRWRRQKMDQPRYPKMTSNQHRKMP